MSLGWTTDAQRKQGRDAGMPRDFGSGGELQVRRGGSGIGLIVRHGRSEASLMVCSGSHDKGEWLHEVEEDNREGEDFDRKTRVEVAPARRAVVVPAPRVGAARPRA